MTIGSLELSLNAAKGEHNADFAALKQTCDALQTWAAEQFPGERKYGEEGMGRLLLSMGMSSDVERGQRLCTCRSGDFRCAGEKAEVEVIFR